MTTGGISYSSHVPSPPPPPSWALSSPHLSPSVRLSGCLSACHFLDRSAADLQIYAVTPVSDITDAPQLERVPERIKSFYRINNVNRFHYDRPFHKGPKDRENEFRVRPGLPLQLVFFWLFYRLSGGCETAWGRLGLHGHRCDIHADAFNRSLSLSFILAFVLSLLFYLDVYL